MINNLSNWIKLFFATIITLLSQIFGGFDILFKTLIFCMIADYITGILCAIYEKKLNSKTGFKGIIKKTFILIITALAATAGRIADFNGLRDMVIGFYIANESLSILENAAKMDVPVVNRMKNILEQLKNKN